MKTLIKEFIIFSISVPKAFYRLLFTKKGSCETKEIIVIQMAKMGDMVCTTPVFRAIKNHDPSVRVVVIGNKVNKELLEHNKDVDQYFVFESLHKTLKFLLSKNGAIGILTVPNTFLLAILILSNLKMIVAPRITGADSPYQTFLYKILVKFINSAKHDMFSYAPGEYLKLLEPIGINSESTKKFLSFSDRASLEVDKIINISSNNLNIIISPSVGNKIKLWPPERFSVISEWLKSKYEANLFVIGTERDRAEVDDMFSRIGDKNKIVNLCSSLSVDELKALISKADLFVGVDTGPVYIAESFDIPIVNIIGPVHQDVQPPKNNLSRSVTARKCGQPAQLFIMNTRKYDKEKARDQVLGVTTEMVQNSILDLLSSKEFNDFLNKKGKSLLSNSS